MSLQDFINLLREQRDVIARAWPSLLAIIAVAAVGIWIALDWRYSGIVANRDSEISALKTELSLFEPIQGQSSDIAKRVEAIEERLRGRFLSADAKAKFIAALKRADRVKSPITLVITCDECLDYGEQIQAAIKEAGWQADLAWLNGFAALRGLKLSWTASGHRKPVTIAFGDALGAAGIQYETVNSNLFNQPALWIGKRSTKSP